MVWLPDHIWEKQKKGKGKGWSQGGGSGSNMVIQQLLKAIASGGGGGKVWTDKPVFRRKEKDTSGGELGEHIGTIKKQGRNYSFIECEALKEAGYGDVFVLRDEMMAYKLGHKVKFTAYLDAGGRLQAKDLKSGLK
eukprot:CAMPEP_0169227722 /NCGR_PEP_ID=MMETSP1016-20121227/24456_1 /TAXON_ID=342587 /ORGANISM="Karlodinium micrum, Strain CCMP2283" /LENGTH=135 /DNA_ID=CAMNT_0009306461 /DNA_START=1 /DNA_END=408 /DNA_ORIENTATION=-